MANERYPEWYADVKSISPNWVSKNFFDFMDLLPEGCKGKNVVSIWWGFWMFEMDAAKAWANVISVDPIYYNKSILEDKIKENIDWLNSKTNRESVELVERLKIKMMKTLRNRWGEKEVQENLKRYDERKAEIDEYIRRRKEQITHLNNWEENQKQYWLVLNSSSWDNIKWIENDSQDLVVMGHTLSHLYKAWHDIKKVLEEWLRILKQWGKLRIIDYFWDARELEEKMNKTQYKECLKANKGSFACCFSKKWIENFIKQEMK